MRLTDVPAGFWPGFRWGFTHAGLVIRQGPATWLKWADLPGLR